LHSCRQYAILNTTDVSAYITVLQGGGTLCQYMY
jgi:hypothetical protein